jgi:hypothetical protein
MLGTILTATLLATAPGMGVLIDYSDQPDSPTGVLRCMARTYSEKSVDSLGMLLTADFRFHFSKGDSSGRFFPDGFSRDQELQTATAMFGGVKAGAQVVLAPFDFIVVNVDDTVQGADPEHADSTQHYQLVAVRKLTFTLIRLADSTKLHSDPALHVFHVVRGDAAVRVAGQPGDSTRWYIRRWLEDLDRLVLALNVVKGKCEEPRPGPVRPSADETVSSRSIPAVLAIHPLKNPACPSLDIRCDLPGDEPARLEVFDVMGRRMARHEFQVPAPGRFELQAGAGVHLAPGAYWLRLTQSARRPSTKMVVVAR